MNIDYKQNALDILESLGATFSATCLGLSFPPWASEKKNAKPVYCFRFTIGKNGKFYDGTFYSSIANAEKNIKFVSAYDVLACLTKYNPGMFSDFCMEMGYDSDSIKAFEIYKAVCEEYTGLRQVFNSGEMEKLAEIS